MLLGTADQRRLRAAHGYIELGMFVDADTELEEIDALSRSAPEILMARLAIYHALQKWELMAVAAGKLAEWNPGEAGYFVSLAYATRRAESIPAARAILERAVDLHPNDGTVQFNLACYEAQTGNIVSAKAYLNRATAIDPKFSLMALEDSDLEPLWNSLGIR